MVSNVLFSEAGGRRVPLNYTDRTMTSADLGDRLEACPTPTDRTMTSPAKTDVEQSLAAAEFLWTDSGFTCAHPYILPTLTTWLTRRRVKTVLDIGCGNGAVTGSLSQRGFDVSGMDASASGLAIARRAHPELSLFQSDVEAPLPDHLQGRFDGVVSIEVIEHLLRPRLLLERAREALRPGGVLIVSTPYHGYLKNMALALTNRFDNHWHPLRDYGHIKFFSEHTLTRLCQDQHFRVTGIKRAGRIPVFAKSIIVCAELALRPTDPTLLHPSLPSNVLPLRSNP